MRNISNFYSVLISLGIRALLSRISDHWFKFCFI